ncbi:hypothetical protein ACQUSR_16845 [Streptomyces sp. P1-3]|uniref:hypothetical protein n=1 Tax=Streptomyces sp. P1-3 TaxID=3421658 RepID=UPI003D35F418
MSARPRLLPWSGPAGQPSYLVTDGGTDSHLWQLADEMEALQLRMGTEMIQHARALVDERKADARALRFLVNRLTEALTDALRVAESRGMRLDASNDEGTQSSRQAGNSDHGPTRPSLH